MIGARSTAIRAGLEFGESCFGVMDTAAGGVGSLDNCTVITYDRLSYTRKRITMIQRS